MTTRKYYIDPFIVVTLSFSFLGLAIFSINISTQVVGVWEWNAGNKSQDRCDGNKRLPRGRWLQFYHHAMRPSEMYREILAKGSAGFSVP
jgi:hypothetical protein